MNYKITVIGSVANTPIYTEQYILDLLNTQETALLYGETFTGRPGTRIYINPESVLKIRSEIRLDNRSAKRWAIQALEKEKAYLVHHPKKTWFIAETHDHSPCIIGNICPRITPLHELFNQNTLSLEQRLNYLSKIFEHYFRVAKQLDIRLDEGLSNFGVDEQGELYYLDDDIYSWDRFISCAQMLGVYIRSLAWLTPDIVAQLSQNIRGMILEYFHDPEVLRVLAGQLKDLFMPNETLRQLVHQFVDGLYRQTAPKQVNQLHHSRYIALIGDIHANLPALDAVLAYLNQNGIKRGVLLGDIVGYGPYPSECITRIQNSQFLVVKGNHDQGLATGNFKKGFSKTAAWVLDWCESRVSAVDKKWLVDLPSVLHEESWMALHGAPIDPTFFNAYVYEMTYHDNLDLLERKNIPVCFHGHTHQPQIYARRGSRLLDAAYDGDVIDLKQFNYALVCPGSVGQPRNGKIGAQFAIYDQQERIVHYHTVPYDLTAILAYMEQEGFPSSLFKMLQGQSPNTP